MSRETQYTLAWSILYLLMTAMMVAIQVVNYGILEFPYYASYLIPAAFLAFGGQLSSRLQALSPREFAWLTGGVAGVLLLPFVPMVRSAVLPALDTHMLLLYPTLALIGGVAMLLVVPRRGLALLLLFAGISLANGAISVEPPSVVPHHLDYPRFDQDVFPQKDVLVAVTAASNAVHAVDTERSMLFWYDLNDPQGRVYEAVASTYLWWWRLVGDRFPAIEADKIAPGGEAYVRVEEGSRIVIMSDANANTPDVLAQANATLAHYGLKAQVLDTTQITQGAIRFTMTFVEIVPENG
ncbi:MAG: hypothetical protein HC876_23155 [Chloroflexaceae bacterium]|nr:hypothetical protein [Chloroflexaceae bacterium]